MDEKKDSNRAPRLVAVDFDGVLHAYQSGWRGATAIPDPPVPGAIEWLRRLLADGRVAVAISSARSHEPGGREAMRAWLARHGLAPAELEQIAWPAEKPPAAVALDDRAVTFRGAFPAPDELLAFEPWWRAPGGAPRGAAAARYRGPLGDVLALQLRPEAWFEVRDFAGVGRPEDGRPHAVRPLDGRLAMVIPDADGSWALVGEGDYVVRTSGGSLLCWGADDFERANERVGDGAAGAAPDDEVLAAAAADLAGGRCAAEVLREVYEAGRVAGLAGLARDFLDRTAGRDDGDAEDK